VGAKRALARHLLARHLLAWLWLSTGGAGQRSNGSGERELDQASRHRSERRFAIFCEMPEECLIHHDPVLLLCRRA
jgi:hypothetical protein